MKYNSSICKLQHWDFVQEKEGTQDERSPAPDHLALPSAHLLSDLYGDFWRHGPVDLSDPTQRETVLRHQGIGDDFKSGQ